MTQSELCLQLHLTQSASVTDKTLLISLCLQLHLKFCYEAVLKHAEHVLQRHGISTATAACSRNTNSAATKVCLCPSVTLSAHVTNSIPQFPAQSWRHHVTDGLYNMNLLHQAVFSLLTISG